MSDPRKLPPDQAWDAVLDMVLRDEAERVEALSPEELAREVAATGRDPEAERAKALALVAKYKKGGQAAGEAAPKPGGAPESPPIEPPVVSIPVRKPQPRALVWLLAAALAVMAVVLLVKRQEIMALFRPEKHEPDKIGPDDREAYGQAVQLRDQAHDACHDMLWLTCQRKLDQAAKLDPAGESSESIKGLRAIVASHIGPNRPDATAHDDKERGP